MNVCQSSDRRVEQNTVKKQDNGGMQMEKHLMFRQICGVSMQTRPSDTLDLNLTEGSGADWTETQEARSSSNNR